MTPRDVGGADAPMATPPGLPLLPEDIGGRTDVGNAARLVDIHGERLRWCPELGGWACYDGKRWASEVTLAQRWAQDVSRRVMSVASKFYDEAKEAVDADPKDPDAKSAFQAAKAEMKHAERSQSANGLAAQLAAAQCMTSAKIDEFDRKPMFLNVANGTVDLESGELMQHCADDKLTKLSQIAFDPRAQCPAFNAFFGEMQPDPDVRAFLWRMIGLTLIGEVREHVLPINYGPGGNGKGVLMSTLLHVLGEHAAALDPKLIMSSKTDQHPTGLTTLFGRRFVSAVETEEDVSLNVALVKTITGGDRITARRMREDFWEFDPIHTLWLWTNHKPTIKETKNAIWRRVYLIPWDVSPAKMDPDLGRKLQAEAPGILAWAVRGCLMYQAEGLNPPESILAASNAYRTQQDDIGPFLSERCVVEKTMKCSRTALRVEYEKWAEKNGEGDDTLSAKQFASKIRELGCEDISSMRPDVGTDPVRGWRGIRLKSAHERAVDALHAESAAPEYEPEARIN